MIRGPCGAINNHSPCKKDEKCMKQYPRDLHAKTITGNVGYLQYCRRSTEDGGKSPFAVSGATRFCNDHQ